ncbi:MAG TPA: phage major capsid protein [Sumerlaeia bacterium]|nr:phage major capsid protein [Sumerlaeia bacterium]
MDVKPLYTERGKIWEEQKAALDKAEKENRDLNAEEMEQYEARNAAMDSLMGRIKRIEDANARDLEQKGFTALPPGALVPGDASEPENRQAAYEKNFDRYVRKHITAEELRASTDPQTIGTAGDGGSSVPDTWWGQYISFRDEASIMRQLATVIQTTSGTLTLVTEGTEGVAAWYDENSPIAVAKETMGTKTLSAMKYGRIIQASPELLNDSMFDIAGWISRQAAKSMGVLEETAFIAGNNSSQPNGIFTAATTGVTAASATAVTADELLELYHSITSPYRRDASWIMADATALLIRKLKDGNQQYLWQPGLQAGQPDRLLNRPVYTSANAPAATAALDAILFGWVGSYYIADRVGMTLQRLDELYAVSDLVGFKVTARTDGELIDTNAVRVLTMGS